MKFNIKSNTILIILFAIILSNCAEENPLLVSPKSQVSTINIRFMNLASDKLDRIFSYDNKFDLPATPYGFATIASNPPSDSAYLYVRNGDQISKKSIRKIKFSPNAHYTFVGIPSNPRDTIQNIVDSIYTLQTSITRPINSLNSLVRLCNLNPDTLNTYSLILGCPSGQVLASNLQYRGISSHIEVRAGGKETFTIIKINSAGIENLGLFEVNLDYQKDYTFIIRKDMNGEIVNFLAEFNNELSGLYIPKKLDDKKARLRIMNYSSINVDISKNDNLNLFSSFGSSMISDYKNVSACNINGKDTFNISNSSQLKSFVNYSLDVNRDYSIFVFDSTTNNKAGKSIFVPPYTLDKQYSGKAIIRVVNGNYLNNGINLSLGARQDNSNTLLKYISGEQIASNLAYGSVSEAVALNPGSAPITIFTSAQPAKYIYSLNYNFEANKSYIISVFNNDDGTCAVSVIDESITNTNLTKSEEGVFIQIVNAIPNKNAVFSMPPILDNVNLGYSAYIATVVKKGSSSAFLSGKKIQINALGDKRLLYVASGDETNIEIFEFGLPFLGSFPDLYSNRVINVAKDLPSIAVYNGDPSTSQAFAESISYGFASPSIAIRSEQKLAYFFLDPKDVKKTFYQANDIKMVFGKTYSLILAGKSNGNTDVKNSGYTTIILQEY